jgi:hypothetical protein
MMPTSKVTLLGKPGNTYTLVHGQKSYMFGAGSPRKVPLVVALIAKKKMDRRGNPIFRVEELPEIIEGKGEKLKKANPKKQNAPTGDRQMSLME